MLQNRNGGNKFYLTHEHIARFLGVHRPGISNTATELRDKGIIDYRRGQIIILDYQELKRLSCSCFSLIE
jgi:CRP-like cAMP-binding protein